MPSKDLVFRLFGEDVNASASMRALARSAEESSRGITRAFGNAPRDISLVAAAATVASVKMAGDFQTATTRLVTDAGEQQRNLAKVRGGLLDISSQTGLTAKDTAAGMYLIESAGFHGANGLKVMKAAAEGAKIGGADIKTVADALTTTMTDFGPKAGDAATVMSKLIGTVSTGKTTMEDLAGSLHSVLPAAASAKLSLSEVLGAVGTMTAEGISADQATQNLNNAILSLQAPSHVAQSAMANIGVSAIDVAQHLGKRGLAGTYDVLLKAMHDHSRAGMIAVNAFNQSAQAGSAMDTELKHMPATLRTTAEAFQKGDLTSKQWAASLKQYPATVSNLGKQFATNVKHATGFSDALKSGEGPVRTSAAQLEKMVGGQTGLQVALHLTGEHMGTFRKNTKTIGDASKESGGHVRGWADTQKNFNQQMAQAGATLGAAGIRIGTVLLPPLTQVAKGFGGFFKDLQNGNPLAVTLATVIGVFAGAMVTLYTATKVYRGIQLAATAAQWLFNLAMDANPIGVIILAIGALITIIVLLVTHWKQVCGFLQTVWAGVCKWLQDSLNTLGKVWAAAWKALTGAVGAAWAAVSGAVQAGIKAVLGFFSGVGGWLVDTGKNLIDGLVNGIKGAIGFVTDTVKNIAGGVIGTFKNVLGIHSPSTVFHGFGMNIGQGLTNGMLGSKNQVAAASNTLAGAVIGMFKSTDISKSAETAALDALDSGTKRLESIASKRAVVANKLKAAQKTLADVQKAAKDYASGVKSNVLQSGDVTQMGSAGDMVQRMSDLVAHTRQFRTILRQLAGKGIDQTTYGELVQAGVDGGGLAAAQSLLANPIDLREVVSLQRQLASAAGGLGGDAARHHYKSALATDRGHVTDLNRLDRAYAREQRSIAASTVRRVERDVHVNINLSGHLVGSETQLAKTVVKAIREATRSGAISKDALKV